MQRLYICTHKYLYISMHIYTHPCISTQYLHNDKAGAGYGLDVEQDSVLKGKRVSIYNQILHGTCLKLVVKGQSYLEPGDLI